MSRRALVSILIVISALAAWPVLVWTCAPWFPNRLLTNPDGEALAAPVVDFSAEIARLLPQPKPEFRARPPGKNERDVFEQTAKADVAELREALDALKVPAAQRDAAIAWHGAVRTTIQKHSKALNSWKIGETYNPGRAQRPPPPPFALPQGLPGEFADYMRGAIAYHQERYDEARTAWQAVLDRPAQERRYRSTWAAFMIGRALLEGDDEAPVKALEWFERVRALAREGYADSLGLAAASLGWQARGELSLGRYEAAFAHYLEQHAAGDTTAATSLRLAAKRALASGPRVLSRLAADRLARGVITAFIVARGGPFIRAPDPAGVRAWLAAVEAAAVKGMEGADRLAWAAYQIGDMDTAARWVERAPADAGVALWVRAKLLLREGKLDEAAGVLGQACRHLPANAVWAEKSSAETDYGFEYLPDRVPARRAMGELGVLQMSRRQYVDALDLLLRGGYWLDAAYVAERVLTPEELIAYVDRTWPEPVAREGKKWHHWSVIRDVEGKADADAVAVAVRYLLGRRLTRLGKGQEARPYYPAERRPRLDAYLRAVRVGEDRSLPDAARAASLREAARIARHEGMELMGTETEPDWSCYDGHFEEEPIGDVREDHRERSKLAPMTDDERRRVAVPAAEPDKRFHYRYTAADHAWAAAELMPDDTEELAGFLYEAGSWLKYRDPDAADRFYKALVNRCRSTRLGREADRLRWFPPRAER